eukprot:s2313_g12.t1
MTTWDGLAKAVQQIARTDPRFRIFPVRWFHWMDRSFQRILLLITLGICDAITVNVTVDADGMSQPLMRSEKVRLREQEEICTSGDLCIENKCAEQIFDSADCAATTEGTAACAGTQVCANKSTTDASGKLVAQFRCCCPECHTD